MVDPFLRAARTCPHCGAREPTLGSRCPSCDRPYEARSWVDRAPLGAPDDWYGTNTPGGFIALPLISLANLVLSGFWELVTLPFRFLRRLTR